MSLFDEFLRTRITPARYSEGIYHVNESARLEYENLRQILES
jgi:hypothetical protein